MFLDTAYTWNCYCHHKNINNMSSRLGTLVEIETSFFVEWVVLKQDKKVSRSKHVHHIYNTKNYTNTLIK